MEEEITKDTQIRAPENEKEREEAEIDLLELASISVDAVVEEVSLSKRASDEKG